MFHAGFCFASGRATIRSKNQPKTAAQFAGVDFTFSWISSPLFYASSPSNTSKHHKDGRGMRKEAKGIRKKRRIEDGIHLILELVMQRTFSRVSVAMRAVYQ